MLYAISFCRTIVKASFLLCLCLPAYAEKTELAELYEGLKNATNQPEAQKIEGQIWDTWLNTGNYKIDSMMRSAMRMRFNFDFDGSIDELNRIIEIDPSYAEAWNQRAIAYFYKKEYDQSLVDIAKVLELEPNHFSAMTGRAIIRLSQNKHALAQQNMIEALKLHPYLRERELFPGLKSI